MARKKLKLKALNFHKIGKAHRLPAVIKLLAREFIEGATYFSVGQWFKELSQYDLDLLLVLSEELERSGPDTEALVLLAEMLALAEGVEVLDPDGALIHVKYLVTVLMFENLYRKGEIEMDHTALSFGADEMERVVAWKKGSPKPKDVPKRKDPKK